MHDFSRERERGNSTAECLNISAVPIPFWLSLVSLGKKKEDTKVCMKVIKFTSLSEMKQHS
jgi:hypothetical protein